MQKYDIELSKQRPQQEVQNEKIEILRRNYIDMLKLDSILKELREKYENRSQEK